MAIIRWDPFSMMRWGAPLLDADELGSMVSPSTSNGLDVYETADSVVVQANLAGVPEDKIEITFEKGILWIRAEWEEEKENEKSEDRKYYSRSSRSYSYKVAVPGNIDAKREPEASVENGILKVLFHKAEEEKPKKIQVKAGK
ncbi:MAG: hypothetical protein UX04_C0002G0169 [Microgenomates group bacterium GW2011_GWF2_45_18]|nr:MAG: hypothetical protein UW18_C0005G0004 [Microgenomates group bacterium GW2011_GWF1_44_10]KKU02026.1 MAG: hypothetical protein UX04_C0002G0169 [Microgenomates group bacterium GW2011_GWF2_45_18]OGJ41209.1 MAG: hypothetical protein A2378_01020 [Candidatus Pacebacteria bacterium RIFOXYB1_FULL_44_10]HAU98989.1 Hsp20/alpha crystallin family protein [Candidatus Paceibacterota bacterium]HAX01297.1 Hsp20/alpha crystallin family protein [Candidatus Paceibacterota bacterium]